MGFVQNILFYLNRKEITKQSYGLRYVGGSSRGYFPYLVLRSVPKLPAVTAVFQLLQITSWGFSSSFLGDNFMYKYVINLIEKGDSRRNGRENNVMMQDLIQIYCNHSILIIHACSFLILELQTFIVEIHLCSVEEGPSSLSRCWC